MTPLIVAAAIPLFAWADRTVGGAGKRSIAFGAVLACALAAYLVSRNAPLAVMLAIWVFYRSLPWKVGGGTTPRRWQIMGAFLRHAIPAAAGLLLFLGHYAPDLKFTFMGLAYAVVATALAVNYAREIDALTARGLPESGQNATQECARGAAYGAAIAAAMIS
jgi:hypothetical protein